MNQLQEIRSESNIVKILEELKKRFYSFLRQYKLSNRYTPDDVINEVYLRFRKAESSGKPIGKLRAWCCSTGFNYVRELSRKHKQLPFDEIDSGKVKSINLITNGLDEEAGDLEKLDIIYKALLELKPEEREILEMRWYEELSWEKIAVRLAQCGNAVKVTTLRQRGHRAEDKLRKICYEKLNNSPADN